MSTAGYILMLSVSDGFAVTSWSIGGKLLLLYLPLSFIFIIYFSTQLIQENDIISRFMNIEAA